jgi:hypothetical protein
MATGALAGHGRLAEAGSGGASIGPPLPVLTPGQPLAGGGVGGTMLFTWTEGPPVAWSGWVPTGQQPPSVPVAWPFESAIAAAIPAPANAGPPPPGGGSWVEIRLCGYGGWLGTPRAAHRPTARTRTPRAWRSSPAHTSTLRPPCGYIPAAQHHASSRATPPGGNRGRGSDRRVVGFGQDRVGDVARPLNAAVAAADQHVARLPYVTAPHSQRVHPRITPNSPGQTPNRPDPMWTSLAQR